MKSITYKASGVDIEKANAFVNAIKGLMGATMSSSVLKRRGSFGALFSFENKKYKNPVLVSSTDGVGTKLFLANALGKHDTVGIDLVAMNVNDILCVGATPLFFLDYIACGKLNKKVLKDVVKGIAKGCKQSGCSLIGGETAEMPGMYKGDDYDLAGFAVGVVDKSKIIDGSKIKKGDVVIGLPSSGIHSNGYSLVRKVFSKAEQKKYAKTLLAPTRIYAKEVLAILNRYPVNGMAHITGGAFYEKLTKILPKNLCFSIQKDAWPPLKVFKDIQAKGCVPEKDMYRIFNMGIGFVLVLSPSHLKSVSAFLKKKRIRFYRIGQVTRNPGSKIIFK